MRDEDTRFRAEAVQVLVAQYSALRSEVAYRTTAQHTLLGLALTGFAAIGGLVITGGAGVVLLLIMPLLASTVGLLWLDHALAIFDIADYVDEKLASEVRILADREMLAWQPWPRRRVRHPVARAVLWTGPVFLGFIMPCLASQILTASTAFDIGPTTPARGAGTLWAITSWWLGLVLTGVLIGTWVLVLIRALQRA